MKIIIINGPNLNLLGRREQNVYGSQPFGEYYQLMKKDYPSIQLEYYQSNVEGELINKIQEVGYNYDGIILNAAGYTHTSIAMRDTIAAINAPVIEVHISNVYKREKFRRHSFISGVAQGIIVGFGLKGYRLALDSLIEN